MAKDPQDLSKGEKVHWNWGGGQPGGKVQEVVEGEATTTTKNTHLSPGGTYLVLARLTVAHDQFSQLFTSWPFFPS